MQATLPETEATRLQILRDYSILDTPLEAEFDDFTRLAAQICGTPIALISLIDEERQWFKSRLGLDAAETCRDVAFCAHALHHTEVFMVPDARTDPRFWDNPLVTGEPFIRFYAGAPLLTAGGHALGTLCVIDPEPHTLTNAQQSALQALARQVIARLELRRGIAERARAEQNLRHSEALKAAILDSALDAIVTINADGRVLEWNAPAETTFGYPAAQAVGRELTELIIPAAYQEAHRRGMAHYLATGEGPVLGQRIEITAVRADGAEFPVELAITPIRLASGPIFTATLRDISARKAAEKNLAAREEQYRLVFENATHGIYRTTPDGHILLANPALLKMLGYDTFEQLAERNLEVGGEAAAYQRTDFKARLEAAGELRGLEAVWTRRDGQPVFVCENAYLVRDADGQPLYYEGSVEDITDRKAAEDALHRAHEELEARVEERTRDLDRLRRDNESLLLAAGEGIYGLDAAGLTTFVNPAAARMLGWAEADLIGQPMHALLHHSHGDGSHFPSNECPIYAVLHGAAGRQVDAEVFWRKDGTSFPVEYIATPLREDGSIRGAVVTFQDITVRREAEAALRRSEVRYQRIAANVPGMVFQFVMRPDGTMEFPYVSEGCRAIYGLAPARICANPLLILDIVHPEDHAAFVASLAKALSVGTHWEWEGRIVLASGEQKWLTGSSKSERLANGDIQGEGLIIDVTARKLAEARIHSLNAELTRAYDATIEGWSRALDLRDHETEGHSRRVTEMTLRLAAALGICETELVHIRRGALLHDIGKMAVPDGVLRKPGPLNDEEWAVMRQHPVWAYEMLLPIEFLRPALNIPYCHHEKWNGSGYPRGLAGENIPLAARLFALVDVWDALSSDRPYRRAWELERILDHLRGLSGSHFEPRLVEVFLRLLESARGKTEAESRSLARAA